MSNIVATSSVPLAERMIIFRNTRFIFDVNTNTFRKLPYNTKAKVSTLSDTLKAGLTNEQLASQVKLFGFNYIIIHVRSILSILQQEVFHPFFVFQVYSVILWLIEGVPTFRFEFRDFFIINVFILISFAVCVLLTTFVFVEQSIPTMLFVSL